MNFTNCYKDYMVELEIRKYTEATMQNYKSQLKLFGEFLHDELGIDDLEDVTPSAIKLYTQFMIRKGMKGSSINTHIKACKLFIQYCFDEGFTSCNPKKSGFKTVKAEKPEIKAFTTKDVKQMLESCKGMDYLSQRDYCILVIMFETGIRCSELAHIKQCDIHDEYITIFGKNSKYRSVPITAPMRKALLRYERIKDSYFEDKRKGDCYFLSRTGRNLNRSAVLNIFKKHGEGITGCRVSPHTARHFFAQQQIKMGTDLYTISRLLGHENVGVTQIYLNSLKTAEIVKIAAKNSVLLNM